MPPRWSGCRSSDWSGGARWNRRCGNTDLSTARLARWKNFRMPYRKGHWRCGWAVLPMRCDLLALQNPPVSTGPSGMGVQHSRFAWSSPGKQRRRTIRDRLAQSCQLHMSTATQIRHHLRTSTRRRRGSSRRAPLPDAVADGPRRPTDADAHAGGCRISGTFQRRIVPWWRENRSWRPQLAAAAGFQLRSTRELRRTRHLFHDPTANPLGARQRFFPLHRWLVMSS